VTARVAAMRRAGVLLVVVSLGLGGCAAMMMGGDGGYQPSAETCTPEQDRQGLCKSR
jgi:hypothetical protein